MHEFVTVISIFFIFISIQIKKGDLIAKKLILLATIIFIIFDGTRWQMGTDWNTYKSNYELIFDHFTPGFDLGFEYYTITLKSIFDNYTFYLLSTASLIFGSLFFIFNKINDKYYIGFLYTFSILIWYSHSMRQLLSVSLLSISIISFYKRNFFAYAFFILIGTTVHFSLIFCLPLYFIYNLNIKSFAIFFISLFIMTYFFKDYLIYLDNLLSILQPDRDFNGRLDSGLKTNFILGYGRKISIYFILFLYIYKLNLFRDKIIISLFSISSISILLYHFAVNFSPIVASRLDIYTGVIFTGFLITEISKKTKTKYQKYLLFTCVVFYIFINYSRLEFMDLFHPYSGLFYNYNYNRILY